MNTKIYYTRNDSNPKFLYLDYGIEIHADPFPGSKGITFYLPDGCTISEEPYRHSQFITSTEVVVDDHGQKFYIVANQYGLHLVIDTYYGEVSKTLRVLNVEE